MIVWRIVRSRHADTALTGEGAKRFGGRFNSKGHAVVYTSATLSLAALEMVVHADPGELKGSFAFIKVEVPDTVARQVLGPLPADWSATPAPKAASDLGDEWLRQATSAVAAVPSAVIRHESNYLLNPAHSEFALIRELERGAFEFDPRLHG